MAIGAPMTREEFERTYGRPPEAYIPGSSSSLAPQEPVKTKGPMKSFFPGAEIGKSLVQAGGNIANLATGGRKKFESGLAGNERWGGKVDVPALIGDYLQAGTLVGAPAVPIAKARPAFESVRFARGVGGVTKGAKAGALAKNVATEAALGYGAVDVGGGLKEGEGMGAFKPGTGALTGGLAGGAIGALSKSTRLGDVPQELGEAYGKRTAGKDDAALFDLIKSDEGKKKAISAFKRAGQEGGVTETGILRKKIKITPTAYDKSRMESVRGIVDPAKSTVENNTRLNNEIARMSREELEPFLQANPRAFNVQTVNARLRDIKIPDLFKADQTLENTYNLVRQRMVSAVERNPKTMEGLWKARKEFDQEVIDQFGDAAFASEKGGAAKRAIGDMRKEINSYIADEIGGTEFRDYMKKLSNMYSVRDNIAEKAYRDLGTNKFQRWWRGLTQTQKNLVMGGAGTIVGGKILFGGGEAAVGAQ